MENAMDPELASEMVKLLVQELKVVRAQLREAETKTSAPHIREASNELTYERTQALASENESLKADNVVLQEEIAKLRVELTRVSSIKSEEYSYTEGLPPHVGGEITRLLAENEDLHREKEEASRNLEKLSILQEKYRRSKARTHEYNEAQDVTLSQMLTDLRAALSSCAKELEESRKAVATDIDLRGFLQAIPYEPVEGQPELPSVRPYHRHIHSQLHKEAVNICKGLYFVNSSEVVWSPSGTALGLVIKPTFQYNPRIPGGAWTKLEDNFETGKPMDLCYLSSKKTGKISRYLGMYEKVTDQGTLMIAPDTLKYLGHDKLDYVSKHTTLFPDLVPPSQAQMIKNMYKQGVIKLQCFVIRCVGVNQTFIEKLRDTRTPPAQRNLSDNGVVPTSTAASEGVRKRKREPRWAGSSNRNFKKRYESLCAI